MREMVGADIGLSLPEAMLLDPELMQSWLIVRAAAEREIRLRGSRPQTSLGKWIEANV
jgi:hypothetical protein